VENYKFAGGLEVRRPDPVAAAPAEAVGNNPVAGEQDTSYMTAGIGNNYPERERPDYNPKYPWNAYDPMRGQSVQDFLTDSIMSQYDGGLAQYWKGEGAGNPRANAAYMAQLLAGSGVTSLADIAAKDDWVNPDRVGKDIYQMVGGGIDQGDQLVGQVTPEQAMERIIINKNTGERINGNYDRARGNTWGGTFAGKGNTGYDVQFDDQGRPYFYTHEASSNDNEMMMAKVLLGGASMAFPALAPYISMGNAAYAKSQGDNLGAIVSALGGAAGISGQMLPGSGLAQGLDYASKGAGIANSIRNKDFISALSGAAGTAGKAFDMPELNQVAAIGKMAKPLSSMFNMPTGGIGSTNTRKK
jgi:hypothetical protein